MGRSRYAPKAQSAAPRPVRRLALPSNGAIGWSRLDRSRSTCRPLFNVYSLCDRAELLAQRQRMTKASQAELVEMMDRGMA